MKNTFPSFPAFIQLAAIALGITVQGQAWAGPDHPTKVDAAAAAAGPLPSLPPDVAELKFNEFFEMPVGPRGLAMTQKLLSLDGKRVRILGHMAHQEEPYPGFFILAPMPVGIAERSDGMADDLPPSVVFVHLPAEQSESVVPFQPGLMLLTGVLSVGNSEESDGRISMVRLRLDAPDGAGTRAARTEP